MALTTVCSMIAARAALDALLAKLNVGGTPATVKVYTGAQPANTLASETGTLLVTMTCSTTAFPVSVDGGSNGLATATANPVTSGTAGNTGTAGHFRALDSTGVCIIMGSCGTSGTDMIFNTTTINSGDAVACTSWVATLPDGTGTD